MLLKTHESLHRAQNLAGALPGMDRAAEAPADTPFGFSF